MERASVPTGCKEQRQAIASACASGAQWPVVQCRTRAATPLTLSKENRAPSIACDVEPSGAVTASGALGSPRSTHYGLVWHGVGDDMSVSAPRALCARESARARE
eukprot:c40075_g1_i1.p1 GENE.c40075_g1_i1~~c40075_g1_i1.p1  ORF type:complete len:105 (+),score=1.33 c40075_g1_i1:25-339(+)